MTTKKLLIVDDEPFTVEMLQTFLQISGYETVGAYNGEDGLVLIKVERPELLILDLMLPDIEGYEVCRRIRQNPETATIPVLILSARAESSSKERAMAAGADAYLTKPVKLPELLAELEKINTKRSAMQAQTTPTTSTTPVIPDAAAVNPAAPAVPTVPAPPAEQPAQPIPSTNTAPSNGTPASDAPAPTPPTRK